MKKLIIGCVFLTFVFIALALDPALTAITPDDYKTDKLVLTTATHNVYNLSFIAVGKVQPNIKPYQTVLKIGVKDCTDYCRFKLVRELVTITPTSIKPTTTTKSGIEI